ncbi:DNA/RNA non-specific endonuclease [Mucilaginibacter pallidiroseus]|uniref:DNA/RNA non-specific endonuclease n=1 Tax=Mucilaginibacter pallidiroseus TaxID=2599295 RepID=A0A563UES8_9SPHI|nr:DNA/RNA non-specific endonuclease [Mucilaginibacter pallidiroseus]TWR29858.1 DNA/RNA non-specific endonuclease [Mucilaginibacter pallidiroseus]
MKFRKLLILSAFILAIASCRKDTVPVMDPGAGNGTGTVTPIPQPYTITETFESGTKGAYAAADVQLLTGMWNFNDAVIGNLAADAKNGTKAVRLRTGSITMNFDIAGLEQISIKHAKYGNDANSTWQLMISEDGGATFTQLGSDITETSTTLVADSFKVTTTKKVRFRIQKTGTTRVNLDDITFKGKGDAGIVIGAPDTGNDGDTGGGNTGTPAPDRGVTAGADAQPVTGDNSNLLFGNPSGAQPALVMVDNYLMDQSYYVESYSSTRGTPNWVSWHIDANTINGTATRQDNFAGFIGLPNGFYQVESNSYSGSGFDRGHNCPSADRTSSVNANSATFLMTNMIPQAPQNNQQTWNNLEGYLRTQVASGNEVYVIMGSYGIGGTGSNGVASKINNNQITVPSNVWKIAVIIPNGNNDAARVTAGTRVIAVNTPNINTINTDWKQYRVTVRDIEKATGYNLLSALPQAIQDAVENKVDNL